MSCIAEQTGGLFLEAKDADELTDALTRAVAVAPPPQAPVAPEPVAVEHNLVMTASLAPGRMLTERNTRFDVFAVDAEGNPADKPLDYTYKNGEWRRFYEPGRYLVRASSDMAVAETVVELTETETLEQEIVLNAGLVSLSVAPTPGADADADAFVELRAGGEREVGYGTLVNVLPAGEVSALGKIGEAQASATRTLSAGEVVEWKLVAAAGSLIARAVYARGGEQAGRGTVHMQLFEAAQALDGSRKRVASSYGPPARFEVPPGEYVLVSRIDLVSKENDILIEPGEETDITISLDAGIVDISVAPDAAADADRNAAWRIASGDVKQSGYGTGRVGRAGRNGLALRQDRQFGSHRRDRSRASRACRAQAGGRGRQADGERCLCRRRAGGRGRQCALRRILRQDSARRFAQALERRLWPR